MTIIVLEMVTLVFQGVERLIFDAPPGAPTPHELTPYTVRKFSSVTEQKKEADPFVQNFGRVSIGQLDGLNPLRNAVVGVFSALVAAPGFTQMGSIFDARFVDLFNTMCANQPFNCS